MKLIHFSSCILLSVFSFCFAQTATAQCETWHGHPDVEKLEQSFVQYRALLKSGDLENAFAEWEKVYLQSPAADGKGELVYADGRKFYMEKYQKAVHETQKQECAYMVVKLAEEQKRCYPDSAIEKLPNDVIALGMDDW